MVECQWRTFRKPVDIALCLRHSYGITSRALCGTEGRGAESPNTLTEHILLILKSNRDTPERRSNDCPEKKGRMDGQSLILGEPITGVSQNKSRERWRALMIAIKWFT